MKTFNSFAKFFPYYSLDSRGELVRRGSFQSGRPGLSRLYEWLGKSEIVRRSGLNLPLGIHDEHIRLTARIIEESRNDFRAQFKSEDFYVLFYPSSRSPITPDLIAHLTKAGIRVLDYSALIDPDAPDNRVGDGHPSAKAHLAVAKKLVEDLKVLRAPLD